VQKGPWFSPGHVELGGSYSVSHLITGGRKLWVIARTRSASRTLLGCTGSFKDFLATVSSPPTGRLIDGCSWGIVRPGDTVFQPELCAHCVFTSDSSSVGFLATWEGGDPGKAWVPVSLFNGFLSGRRNTGEWRKAYRAGGMAAVEEWVETLPDRPRREWKLAIGRLQAVGYDLSSL